MAEDEKPGEGVGCTVLFLILAAGAWWLWSSAFGCMLADNFDYVTKECALKHLQKPACNSDRDILEVDEVKDLSYTDEKGVKTEVRSIIYSYRKRPMGAPVSAEILRDDASMFKIANGTWLASCENLPESK